MCLKIFPGCFHILLLLVIGVNAKSVVDEINPSDEDANPVQPIQPGLCIMSVITYPDSDDQGRESYDGQVSNGEPNGLGILFYSEDVGNDRKRYEGQFRNGVPDGLGIIYYRNDTKIEGHFSNGELVNQVYKAGECKELLGVSAPGENDNQELDYLDSIGVTVEENEEDITTTTSSTTTSTEKLPLDSKYILSPGPFRKWKSADKYCTKKGGKLAEIMSDTEMQQIISVVDYIHTKRYDYFWIGLTDQKTEGKFVWTSTGQEANYTNWNEGEPNGNDDKNNEDCVHLENFDIRRRWNDASCNVGGIYALCEMG